MKALTLSTFFSDAFSCNRTKDKWLDPGYQFSGDSRFGTLFHVNHTRITSLAAALYSYIDSLINLTLKVGKILFAIFFLLVCIFTLGCFCSASKDDWRNAGVFLGANLFLVIVEPIRLAYSTGRHLLGTALPFLANESPKWLQKTQKVFDIRVAKPPLVTIAPFGISHGAGTDI